MAENGQKNLISCITFRLIFQLIRLQLMIKKILAILLYLSLHINFLSFTSCHASFSKLQCNKDITCDIWQTSCYYIIYNIQIRKITKRTPSTNFCRFSVLCNSILCKFTFFFLQQIYSIKSSIVIEIFCKNSYEFYNNFNYLVLI